ncbi:unnamed protein product [Caenorhabditis nigoni]
MSSLSEMPEVVMENIIGLLDFRSVLTLRQVCRDFLNCIDDLDDSKLPDSKFKKIDIFADGSENVYLVYENLDLFFRHEFIYSVKENSRSIDGKITHLGSSNTLDVAVRDLELILKFQKCNLERLYLNFGAVRLTNNSSVDTLAIKLCDMIKELNRTIKTKNLTIQMDAQSKFMLMLPFIDSDTLEDIYLRSNVEKVNINGIVKTEQWKNAESIEFDFYASHMKVQDICHLSEFQGKMFSISAQDLDFLKKTFITSSKFKCSAFSIKCSNRLKEVSNLWGPSFFSNCASCWYFQMKDSNEKILNILFLEKFFCFTIITLKDVPNGAIVHDYNEN